MKNTPFFLGVLGQNEDYFVIMYGITLHKIIKIELHNGFSI